MTKHTQGEWLSRNCNSSGWMDIFVIESDGLESLPFAACKHYDQEANARLITAAPGLLGIAKELEECAAYWSDYDVPLGIVDRLRAAIAKAEGKE